MAAARVDWKRRRVEGDQGGDVVVAASVEDDGSSGHDPNDDRPRHMCDSFDLALRSEELTLEKRLWSDEAMGCSLSIRRGVVRDIVWWYPKIDSPSYALVSVAHGSWLRADAQADICVGARVSALRVAF